MTKTNFVYKLHRAWPFANIEPTADGYFRIGLPKGDFLFVNESSSPYYWRCVRKIMRRKLQKMQGSGEITKNER